MLEQTTSFPLPPPYVESTASPSSVDEIIQLGAIDSQYFCETFFRRTVRQKPPRFHDDIWSILDNPANRLCNIQVFRGGAKTSILRMFTAKRIAYGLAHTILYIGKSEGHAIRSVNWLRNQVDRNRLFSSTFNLRPGGKWQGVEAEIWHGTDDYPIWIMGAGITGSIRGINFDDFRPDLIVVDDVMDEENSATSDQREKIKTLLYGAVKESLAPRSEAPDAKLAMLQTPLNKEDASTEALRDPEWTSAVFGCWTVDTRGLPIDQQESSWPDRFPSEDLRKEKEAAIARNKASIWYREKECRITSPETSAFNESWLKKYELLPEYMAVVMAIDPVPPPSPIQVAQGMVKKDYEAFAVVGRWKGDYFLLEYDQKRGHDPSWTIATFMRLALKWRPLRTLIESVAYQRVLSWILKRAMEVQQRYFVIVEDTDTTKSKYDRIVNSLNGIASEGHLYVRDEHVEFINQFREYPDVAHEDLLEAVAVAVRDLSGVAFDEYAAQMIEDEEDNIPALKYQRGAP